MLVEFIDKFVFLEHVFDSSGLPIVDEEEEITCSRQVGGAFL
jgi:hypothetical protein